MTNSSYRQIPDVELKPSIRVELLQMIENYALTEGISPYQMIKICGQYFQYLQENKAAQFFAESSYDDENVNKGDPI